MTLLHLTDLHLFDNPAQTLMGWNTESSFNAVLAAALDEERPDAVLLTGDLAQDGQHATYARLALQLRALGRSCLWLPGNHDHAGAMAEALAPFPWMRTGLLDLPWGSQSDSGWRVITLDSSTPDGDQGVLSVTQLQRLDAALRATPTRKTLVALHHPPIPVGAAWLDAIGLTNAAAFWRVVDRYAHVRGVVFGHAHQLVEASHGTLPVLGTPATCFQFAPQSTDFALDHASPGYRLLHLGADGTLRSTLRRVTVASACAPTAAGY